MKQMNMNTVDLAQLVQRPQLLEDKEAIFGVAE
jgi:hypothetical protein